LRVLSDKKIKVLLNMIEFNGLALTDLKTRLGSCVDVCGFNPVDDFILIQIPLNESEMLSAVKISVINRAAPPNYTIIKDGKYGIQISNEEKRHVISRALNAYKYDGFREKLTIMCETVDMLSGRPC